jgi:hypothetical protein
MKTIDLHAHTTASDGSLTPTQLVQLAKDSGLSALAVTDHDTVAGYAEAFEAGKKLGVEVVPAVEISGIWPTGTLHMLGYLVDPKSPELLAALNELLEGRNTRNPRIIANLNKLGMAITIEEAAAQAGGKVIGRPHIAKVLLAKGYVKTIQEAFDKYLADNAPAFENKEVMKPADAIASIHAAGGLAVLAHPNWLKCPDDATIEKAVVDLKAAGIDGVEVWHSDHKEHEEQLFARLAAKHGLLTSGGSDFHGASKGDIRLGKGRGRLNVPYEVLENLKAAKAKRAAAGKN